MSRAFVKETDEALELLPERPISSHRNFVTAAGLAAMDREIARLRAAIEDARRSGDETALARAQRDLRYWTARHASAELQPMPANADDVRFGAAVTIAYDDGREATYRIVGEDEADPAQGSVSYISPLARALMGKAIGDVARVAGREVEIVAIG